MRKQPPGQQEHLYKLLVIGDLGVGKTSIIKRYVHHNFSPHYRATIGVDFALKVLSWDSGTVVRLQLWDIAGPGYLRDRLLPPIASQRPVRSHRVGLLRVPSTKQCRLAAPRGRAFSVAAPALWNELPPGLRQLPDLRTFRRELKTIVSACRTSLR
ncbi:uncharacterized protein LOC131200056 isoform X1 [Ahaetulla prasina]|uniref:uncharacterized protein LOC131200056 isoform X1 n=1 Tax=Ahaetulla prasina TaxID=499056 RepID=UPI002648939C|nr:uncharacterized protein LOC131200056 isoform X1 [Ahaetulla prasina]